MKISSTCVPTKEGCEIVIAAISNPERVMMERKRYKKLLYISLVVFFYIVNLDWNFVAR